MGGGDIVNLEAHMKTNWTVRLSKLLDVLGELPNTSPEGGVRTGGGTMTDGRSERAGLGDLEESLGGGDSVVGHDEISRGSLK
jgi:hypothetical protein